MNAPPRHRTRRRRLHGTQGRSMKHAAQIVFGVAILAAWASWDLGSACVRTFIFGHSASRQLEDMIEAEDET